MKTKSTYNHIGLWTERLLAQGRYGFGLSELKGKNIDLSDVAVKLALKRLTDKGKILSIFKGYYLIIPPQYSKSGVLPPQLYLDAFMKHLDRPYYMALLNAAAYYGASHQQPQEYFVITGFPVLRPTQKKGLKVNYISIKSYPEGFINKVKTQAGYLNISNSILTACDLVHFEKRIGGLNRAASVIDELAEEINSSDFSLRLIDHVPVTALQRLGYLLDRVNQRQELADALFECMGRMKVSLYRIPLQAAKEVKGFSSDSRWKVIVNTDVEIDK